MLLSSTRIVSAADRERLIPVVDRALHSWLTYAPYLDLFRRDLRRIRAGTENRVGARKTGERPA